MPFDCTGYSAIDLTDRGLTSPFDMNKTLQFETCSTIITLWLGCNNFVTLERGTVQWLSKLEKLWLSNNPALRTIIPGVFQGLGALQILYLSNNPVLDTLSPGVFEGLIALKTLWLTFNPALSTLSPGVFQGLSKLYTLYLSYNQAIRTLSPGVFQGLDALRVLSLNSNPSLRLESLTEASTDLNQLEAIYLQNSGVSVVRNGLFVNLPKLTDISMSGNPSVCQMDPSAPGRVTCKCASDYFNYSQELPGGGDGYCLATASALLAGIRALKHACNVQQIPTAMCQTPHQIALHALQGTSVRLAVRMLHSVV